MSSSSHTSLLLLLVLLLLVLQVNIVNSFQQEEDGRTNQTKGESHRPLRRYKRRWIITTLELQEEDPGPFPKLVGELFSVIPDDTSLMYLISGPGVDEYPEIGLFSIEEHESGKIYVHRTVDRETTPSFMVYFDVVNRSTGKIVDKSLTFNIRITDVNDHAPQFPEKEFDVNVREDHDAGQPIFQMSTVDLDQENTPNSQVFYFLVSQTPVLKESGFRIERYSGEIRLSGCLDYETAPRFTLVIGARDYGEPQLSSTATVHVNVQEGNNRMPTFAQENYEIQISEGQPSQGVLRLLVQDGDTPLTSAWRAKFHIVNGNEEGHFDILTDPETNEGILNVIKPLDYETHPVRSLVVVVENEELLFSCEGGKILKPRKAAASATVSVQVMDANDPPTFHPGSFIVSEVDGAKPGIQLGTFNALDPDKTASQIRYKLVHDPANWVTVDERSGAVITRKEIDRESPYVNNSFYIIIVHAVDDGLPPQTGTGTLMLFLSDINDNAPTLHPRSQYVEVCESAVSKPLIIEAEDGDLQPYSDPFTFELDDTEGNARDTWKLGEQQVALLFLLRCYFVSEAKGHRCSIPPEDGQQTLITYNDESKVISTQVPQERSDVKDQLKALLINTAEVGAKPGAKEVNDMLLSPESASEQARFVLGTPGYGVLFEPRGVRNKYPTSAVYPDPEVPRRTLEVRAGTTVAMLSQKLCGVDVLDDDTGYLPKVYTEEGPCERAETLSSLAFSEQDLPPDLLDYLGSKAVPLEEIYSESGVPS
ncbi:cadherin-like protein 26 isoform X3 [Equus przewalskii]|uniref:Cadherin-like protein 26 isoform X3 n=1 Tax=Equus przewalskii TaxID=9798 RepID=A0ABM4LZ80_EQUPR|nr:cadherin-like protein 26 isoform X3 [Equus caballus]